MSEPQFCQVVTTIDSVEAAAELAHAAVRERLAACAQVTGPVTSTYWWQGELQTATEWQVIFKTTLARYDALAQMLRRRHGYQVPEILCLPVLAGDPQYLSWIADQTRAP